MSWYNRHEDFDLDEGELRELEQKAREALGDDEFEELKAGIKSEVTRNRGLGDIPPGYNSDKDPLMARDDETAHRIATVAVFLVTGAIGGAIAYKKLSGEEKQETEAESEPEID